MKAFTFPQYKHLSLIGGYYFNICIAVWLHICMKSLEDYRAEYVMTFVTLNSKQVAFSPGLGQQAQKRVLFNVGAFPLEQLSETSNLHLQKFPYHAQGRSLQYFMNFTKHNPCARSTLPLEDSISNIYVAHSLSSEKFYFTLEHEKCIFVLLSQSEFPMHKLYL